MIFRQSIVVFNLYVMTELKNKAFANLDQFEREYANFWPTFYRIHSPRQVKFNWLMGSCDLYQTPKRELIRCSRKKVIHTFPESVKKNLSPSETNSETPNFS